MVGMHTPDISKRSKTVDISTASKKRATDKSIASADGKDPAAIPLTDPTLYINRELSQLSFQRRVLQEAFNASNPLLERLKFLSIVGSNLEEFFMVRVAGLKRQIEANSVLVGPDGLTPIEQLDAIKSEVVKLLADAQECLFDILLPALSETAIQILSYEQLSPEQKSQADEYFVQHIYPVLTPLAVDPGHPFPHISNLSLNLAVMIREANTTKERFARVKVPDTLRQLIPISSTQPFDKQGPTSPRQLEFVWLDDLVRANLQHLFPGMVIMEAHTFYVVRDAELEIQEWEAEDLLETTEEGIRQRRFGDVVNLQIHKGMPAHMLEILVNNLQVEPQDVYFTDWPRAFSSLKYVASVDRHDLKFTPFIPSTPTELNPDIQEESSFATIARHDVLLHHPYNSFQPVVNFLDRAAKDPNVLAIKTTLYRIGKNSPVVGALLSANEHRKQVAALVELKARFDEESNIGWAKALEREGVHVVYGLLGLKIHAKVAMIVRKEGDVIKRYLHLGTGNYNPITAHLYSDIGLFTSNEDIGADVTDLFNYLTGYSAKKDYKKLLVAPINLRQRMQEMILREIEHQKNGKSGHIIFKTNALVDEQIIQLLYQASQQGVRIDLLVRGICCLKPNLEGISENIRVVSVVGRFLEHSRIYFFNNAGMPEIYCGSADLMPRNLDRRVEVLFPINDPELARYVRDDILETYLRDRENAWLMQSDGSYEKLSPEEDSAKMSAQQWFMANTAHLSEHHKQKS
jgi:polyphosphate kinase